MIGREPAWSERWMEHPQATDPFWAPMQCGAALERITVPVLLVGGWHDLFIEQTLEQYRTLAGRGVPARLLVGPWAHLDLTSQGAVAINESLAWLDRYAGPGPKSRKPRRPPGSPPPDHPVRIWVGGEGAEQWREIGGWPPPGVAEQRWYLGTQRLARPCSTSRGRSRPRTRAGRQLPLRPGRPHAVAGRGDHGHERGEPGQPGRRAPAGRAGVQQRSAGRAGRDHRRGRRRVFLTRDNPYADLFVRLCDVDPRGRSRNVCDGIVRLTEADPLTGTVRVSLVGAAHRFGRGHRIRLQVAGGAFPRFARNPGNGQVDATAADLVPTQYDIGLDAAHPSVAAAAGRRNAVRHARPVRR